MANLTSLLETKRRKNYSMAVHIVFSLLYNGALKVLPPDMLQNRINFGQKAKKCVSLNMKFQEYMHSIFRNIGFSSVNSIDQMSVLLQNHEQFRPE